MKLTTLQKKCIYKLRGQVMHFFLSTITATLLTRMIQQRKLYIVSINTSLLTNLKKEMIVKKV